MQEIKRRKPSESPTLFLMKGPSGSGKSTMARHMIHMDKRNNTIRLNRDDIRSMLSLNSPDRGLEELVTKSQWRMAEDFLAGGYNVIIDDTNLSKRTLNKWLDYAKHYKYDYVVKEMETDLDTCIVQDSQRDGKARVGRPVVERQFLAATKLVGFNEGKPIVIVDIDGTVANNTANRSPYDESRVKFDTTYPEIVQMVRDLYYGESLAEGVKHCIVMVSGRHSSCGHDTCEWLHEHEIPFDHIFMRHSWDNRQDTVVKEEIFREMLKNVDMSDISFVVDDRPSVLNMWFDKGLRIFPAREIKEPF